MANSKEHYERVLSSVYAWMLGGFPAALDRNAAFFRDHGVTPRGSGLAVDLGAGCGFQSIPLARLGFDVIAIDLDRQLLDQMKAHSRGLRIEPIEDDLLRFKDYLAGEVELAVCMTDTLLHLETRDDVLRLISNVYGVLERGGRFFITFRDLTKELRDAERIIPVRSDDTTVFTCFLEYEPETVKVHDIVYRNVGGHWELAKSFYRKLRLSERWVSDALKDAGFEDVVSQQTNGLVTVTAACSK